MKGCVKVFKKFVALLDKTNKTAYQVSKDTGIGQHVFSIGGRAERSSR